MKRVGISFFAPAAAQSTWKHIGATGYTLASTAGILQYQQNRGKKKKLPAAPMERLSEKQLTTKFIDQLPVRVKGGNGGNGCISLLRDKISEFGGPDGGDGGNGGHVILEVDSQKNSLSHIARYIKAENGVNGRTKDRHGRNAQHLVINVPRGTIIKDNETGQEYAELSNSGDQFVLCRGGAGGHGNAFFTTATETTPRYAEEGGTGQERRFILELRLLAKVGLIGFPNAGKSTLLRALSRAQPKVADYPFTTLNPHIGMIEYDDQEQVSVADIPGLIEGSHLNRGLGFQFLRHISKCACLLYVIDLSSNDPVKQFEQLQYELEQFQQYLSKRPHAVIANKIDLENTADKLEKLKSSTTLQVIPISAKHQTNTEQLKLSLREMVEKYTQYADKTDSSNG